MRASKETYVKVAEYCSAYEPADVNTMKSAACDCGNKISCVKCKYFDDQKYCRLDLYDRIVEEHGLES